MHYRKFTAIPLMLAAVPIGGALAFVGAAPSYRAFIGSNAGAAYQAVNTTEKPVMNARQVSKIRTTALPGGGTALLVDNGDGTSMLIAEGGLAMTVPTPQ